MYLYSSCIFIWILSVLSVTRLVAGYRPSYRPHDTSMDLAQPHHLKRIYIVTADDYGGVPDTPAGELPPHVRNLAVSPTLRFRRFPVAAAVITPDAPSLAARQVHNADYGTSSSNTPSSSSNANSTSTKQSPPPSSSTDPRQNQDQDQDNSSSAADSTHSTNKREQSEIPGLWDGRRPPRAAATRRMLAVIRESDQHQTNISEDSSSDKSIELRSDNSSEESMADPSPKDDSNGTDNEPAHNEQDIDSNSGYPQYPERTIAFRFRR